MKNLMFIALLMGAVYFVFHIGNVFVWWWDKIKIVANGVWTFVKKIFKKKV